jgi:RNA polymerase sigma-70 factor (ECF subfamily)
METVLDEREAIERLRRGDVAGLEFLVNAYQLRAVRAAYLITRDRHLAEDVAQGAFVKVFRRIGQFDIERPFAPWLLRIVTNDAVKAASRRERAVSLDSVPGDPSAALAEVLPDPAPGPESAAEQAEARLAVWEAVGKLPPSQRAALVLRYYVGLSEAEMAERTGRAAGTVKWLLHAGRKRMRELLGPAFGERPVTAREELDNDR